MTTIKKINGAPFISINGKEQILSKKTSDGFYHLPENESGIKYIMIDLVNFHFQNSDEFELNKENSSARKFGIHNSVEKKIYPKNSEKSSGKKNPNLNDLKEFMNDEEWGIIQKIIETAKIAYDKAHEKKPLTEREKLEKKLEALQKKLNELNGD